MRWPGRSYSQCDGLWFGSRGPRPSGVRDSGSDRWVADVSSEGAQIAFVSLSHKGCVRDQANSV